MISFYLLPTFENVFVGLSYYGVVPRSNEGTLFMFSNSKTLMLVGEGYVFRENYAERHLKTGISKPGDRGRSLRW